VPWKYRILSDSNSSYLGDVPFPKSIPRVAHDHFSHPFVRTASTSKRIRHIPDVMVPEIQ
jgi:hypothetical protein